MDDIKNSKQNQSESEAPQPLYETAPAAPPASQQANPAQDPAGAAAPQPQTDAAQTDQVPEFVVEETPSEFGVGDEAQGGQFVPIVEGGGGDTRMKYIMIAAAVVFFLLIFGFLLWFFLGRSGGGNKEVKLIYWGLWETESVMQPIIDEYEQKNPKVTIEYQRLSAQEDYLKKIQVREGRGPDIFRFHNTWVPQLADVLTPLPGSVMSGEEFENTFYPIHTRDLKVQNSYYGIPLMVDGLVLIYNEDLLKKAGKSLPPTTWVDMVEYIQDITVPGQTSNDIVLSTAALGTANNIEHSSDIFGLFLLLNGGSVTDLSSDEAVGALREYRKFAEPPNATWNESMPNSIDAFVQEKVVMIIAPSWELVNIRAQNPNLKIRVAPIPILPGSDKGLSVSNYWVEGVSKHSQFQQEAWSFLKYLSSAPVMEQMYTAQAKERFFGVPYSRKDLADKLSGDQYFGAVVSQAGADIYRSIPIIDRTFDGGLNDENASYIRQAIDRSTDGVAYDTAMSTAQSGVSEVLKQYNIQ